MNHADALPRAQLRTNSSGMIEIPTSHGRHIKAVAVNVLIMVTLMFVIMGSSSTIGLAMEGNNPDVGDLMEVHGLANECHPQFWHDPFAFKDFTQDALRKAIPRLAF